MEQLLKKMSSNSGRAKSLRQRSQQVRHEVEERLKKPRKRGPKPRPKELVAQMSKYKRKTANARERARMHEINEAIDKLKAHIPDPQKMPEGKPEKLTKVHTLRMAINYIKALQQILRDGDATAINSRDEKSPVGGGGAFDSARSDHGFGCGRLYQESLATATNGQQQLRLCERGGGTQNRLQQCPSIGQASPVERSPAARGDSGYPASFASSTSPFPSSRSPSSSECSSSSEFYHYGGNGVPRQHDAIGTNNNNSVGKWSVLENSFSGSSGYGSDLELLAIDDLCDFSCGTDSQLSLEFEDLFEGAFL